MAKQRAHYLNDLKLGAAETAIRLLEWQAISIPGDVWVAVGAVVKRLVARMVMTSFPSNVIRELQIYDKVATVQKWTRVRSQLSRRVSEAAG